MHIMHIMHNMLNIICNIMHINRKKSVRIQENTTKSTMDIRRNTETQQLEEEAKIIKI